jgi:hypothetical protein
VHLGCFYSTLGPAGYKTAQPTWDVQPKTESRGRFSPFAAGGFIGRIRLASGEGSGKVLSERTTGPRGTNWGWLDGGALTVAMG